MPVSSWSFSAATPDGAAPMTGMPASRKAWRDRVGGGRLAGTRESDDADDAARARGDFADHRFLLGGEDDPVGPLDRFEAFRLERRALAASRPRSTSASAARSIATSSAVE